DTTDEDTTDEDTTKKDTTDKNTTDEDTIDESYFPKSKGTLGIVQTQEKGKERFEVEADVCVCVPSLVPLLTLNPSPPLDLVIVVVPSDITLTKSSKLADLTVSFPTLLSTPTESTFVLVSTPTDLILASVPSPPCLTWLVDSSILKVASPYDSTFSTFFLGLPLFPGCFVGGITVGLVQDALLCPFSK
ncbi:hypothetical protein Tco_1426848, partial [Tanacetum coccineum]